MFAMINMSLFDSYVANWDSKYQYNHWRPYTAIRARQPSTATRTRNRGRELGAAPHHSAVPGLRVGPRHRNRRGDGDPEAGVRRPGFIHHGFDHRSPWNADALLRQFQRGRSRVRGLESEAWLSLSLRHERGLALGRAVAGWLDENHLLFRGGGPPASR